MKRAAGFTLIELLIVMLLIGFVLAATSSTFVGLLRGYKQQSKIAETNIAGIISLELLRRDIESAGYGLPWVIFTPYNGEAVNAVAQTYNDYDLTTPYPPRAILSGLVTGGTTDGSAYLVVKAMNLAQNAACTKWALLPSTGAPLWSSSTPTNDNLQPTDRVVLISPGSTSTNSRTLVNSGLYSTIKTEFIPEETRLIYGVDESNLRMPFNRADYYVNATGSVTIPGRCAPRTGVLVKSIINQNGGGFNTLPLLDCVADMQVVTYLDTTVPPDGTAETFSTGLWVASGATAAQTIRDQLKEVHVYVLAHEGQRDTSYTYSPGTILVGEKVGATVYGRNFDLTPITDWQNYRWKIYTLVVRPNSLR